MAKKKASSTDERVVYDYLKKTNRPYSSTDIFNNLQSKYPKSMITKSLERLVQDDMITSKTFGKMTIYVVTQELQENDDAGAMEQLDKNIQSLDEKVNALKDENRKKESTTQKLKSQLSTPEAREKMDQLCQENETLRQRLEELQAGGNTLIKEEDKMALEKQLDQYQKLWKKRKATFREIYKAVTEHLTMPLEEFKEELGIEEDP